MRIEQIRIQGFRSLQDVVWLPGRLNLLIGPNGSGKSNFLRALGLLQRAATGDLPEEILRFGGIGPLLWDGSVTDLKWTLRTGDPSPMGPAADLEVAVDNGATQRRPSRTLVYELFLRRVGQGSSYRVEHELLADPTRMEKGEVGQPLKFLERDPRHAVTLSTHQRRLVALPDSVPEDQTLLSLAAGPFSNAVVLEFRDGLSSWGIYHDLRVDLGAHVRQASVARHETRVAPDGQNLIPVLHTLYTTNRDFKKLADAAMSSAFGEEYEELVFPPAADQRVQLRLRWRSLRAEQSASDLPDGMLRFLMLLAIFASPNPGSLIAVDEPELGLHPRMFPIVAELASEASRRTQVLLTTHSPQLLDAFSEVTPKVTVAAWADGKTRFAALEHEDLRRWLDDFSLGALFRSGALETIA